MAACDPASIEVKFNTICEDGQFCLEMTVIVNTNIDPEIFVHRQLTETDPTGCLNYEFVIASSNEHFHIVKYLGIDIRSHLNNIKQYGDIGGCYYCYYCCYC